MVDYQQRFDYSHLLESIQSILGKYEGTRVFVYKEHETATVGPSCIEFDVYYCLIVPQGEQAPKAIRMKGLLGTPVKYDWFSSLSLDWVGVHQLKDDALKSAFGASSDRVFLLQNKTRKFRQVDDETKTRFMTVSTRLCVSFGTLFPC